MLLYVFRSHTILPFILYSVRKILPTKKYYNIYLIILYTYLHSILFIYYIKTQTAPSLTRIKSLYVYMYIYYVFFCFYFFAIYNVISSYCYLFIYIFFYTNLSVFYPIVFFFFLFPPRKSQYFEIQILIYRVTSIYYLFVVAKIL